MFFFVILNVFYETNRASNSWYVRCKRDVINGDYDSKTHITMAISVTGCDQQNMKEFMTNQFRSRPPSESFITTFNILLHSIETIDVVVNIMDH